MPKDLQLLVKPVSADCNQYCAYCFYRRAGRMYPQVEPHRMSPRVLEGIIRRYLRLRLPQSVFCWQGGEPTLAGLDFYRRAALLMQVHGAAGQNVSNAFQTNGLLLDRNWCDLFVRYCFLVGLSLDGPAELHDAYRKLRGDTGSHRAVLQALRLLRERGVEFNVLTVVNDLTAGHAGRIYRYFRELGITHMQFIPCVEAAAEKSGPAPFTVLPEAYGDFLCELFDLWLPDATAGISIRLFDALLRREILGEAGPCDLDGACGEYLVIEYNGDAYPCDFFVEPEQRLGNILTTLPEKLIERRPSRELRKARSRLPAECVSCTWRDLCRGGCPKDRLRIAGRSDTPTWLCKAYRRFFAHAAGPIRALAGAKRRDAQPAAALEDRIMVGRDLSDLNARNGRAS